MKIVLLKYLLGWYVKNLVSKKYTEQRSQLVNCCDYLLENME